AFTGKVRRFGPMMTAQGFRTIHYGVGFPDNMSGWSNAVDIMTPAEQNGLLGYDPAASGAQFVGRDANRSHPLYIEFNKRLQRVPELAVKPGDIICAPFGWAHQDALTPALVAQTVETGVGYPDQLCFYRIYESQAWLHWHMGKWQRSPFI